MDLDPTRRALRESGQAVVDGLGHGARPPRPRPLQVSSVPGLEHFTTDALWGSVWTRPGLDRRTRVLVTLAVLSSLQRLPQLRTYLNSACNAGIARAEIEEVLVQCSVQAGFPTTVNAFELWREVLEQRGEDPAPATEAAPEESLDQLDAEGQALMTELFGPPGATAPPGDLLDQLEARFVFGQLYRRPGLDLATRVLCTVASLCALGRLDELARWGRAAERLDLWPGPVDEVLVQCAYYAGFPAARAARAAVTGGAPEGAGPES